MTSGQTHPGTGNLYLISGAEFKQNGTIVGISYTADTTGTITIQVSLFLHLLLSAIYKDFRFIIPIYIHVHGLQLVEFVMSEEKFN